MTRKFSVVTTFHSAGYEKYGRRMIDTFLANWPKEVHLYVYAEDCQVTQTAPNLTVYDFHQRVPALVAFKDRYRDDPRANGKLAMGPPGPKGKQRGIGFKWDAVRFSHKIYAVCDAARTTVDTVFWMDADMVCHSPITLATLDRLMPPTADIAYLGRKGKYTECGLWAIDMSKSSNMLFVSWMQEAYDQAETGVFAMKEFHDCWVFDRTRERLQAQVPAWQQLDWSAHLVMGEGHPLINTEWGAYLDHLKGNRKDSGRSKSKDLVVNRTEGYWK
jgi:hypothetical protein